MTHAHTHIHSHTIIQMSAIPSKECCISILKAISVHTKSKKRQSQHEEEAEEESEVQSELKFVMLHTCQTPV